MAYCLLEGAEKETVRDFFGETNIFVAFTIHLS